MTQHTDLIERLRASSEDGLTPDDAYAAAEALEAKAREIERLRAELDRAHKVAALIHEGLKTIPQDEPTQHGAQP